MKAINLTPYNFILKEEKKKKKQTIFILRGMNGAEGTRHTTLRLDSKYDANEAILYAVGQCLLGWKGLLDSNGKEIAFSDNQDENIALLHSNTIGEIYVEIEGATAVSKEQKKK